MDTAAPGAADTQAAAHSSRPVMRAALALLFVLGTAAFGALLLTQTESGRGFLAAALAREMSRNLAGQVEIAAVTEVSSAAVEVRGLSFLDTRGEPALVLDRARVRPDWGALWAGKLRITGAETHGGQLRIVERPSGEVTLEEAFASPLGGDAGRGDGSSNAAAQKGNETGSPITIQGIAVHDLRVSIELRGVEPLVVAVSHALARVDVTRGPEVDFDHVQGRVTSHPLGDEAVKLLDVSGRYRGAVQALLALRGALSLAGDHVQLRLAYYDREQEPVVIRLQGLSADSVKLRGLAALSNLANADVTLE